MREIKMSANGGDIALIENGKEVGRLTSYRELGTAEEVFDHYFGDFLD